MQETREFPTEVVASLTSGVLLCDFSAMHECAEFVMGHPIWTHHFADKKLWRAMRRTIVSQVPMTTTLTGITKENWQERRDGLIAEFGPTQTLTKGDGHTAMSPLDGIPEGKPTVIITA